MDQNEDTGSPSWGASLFMQTEDAARAFIAAASAATTRSSRPSVVFSSKDEKSNTQLQKLQRQISRVLRGFSPSEAYGAYNPEILTSQKRQWARFQMQSVKPMKEPTKVFESMVVVGIHPNADFHALQSLAFERQDEETKKQGSLLNHNHQVYAEPNIEPQVLFVYPPRKQLPLKCADLLSFCFPGGVEVRAVERTPSLSELNEILQGQEQLKQSNQSFVFRLQVADDSTLYGCCILVEEIVQKPSNLVSMLMEERAFCSPLSRHIMTTSRCYCILSRLPFFDLHFGILKSIFIEERYERLTKGIHMLNLLSSQEEDEKECSHENSDVSLLETCLIDDAISPKGYSDSNPGASPSKEVFNNKSSVDGQLHEVDLDSKDHLQNNSTRGANQITEDVPTTRESANSAQYGQDNSLHEIISSEQSERHGADAILPLLQYHLCGSSDSSSSFQGSPSAERNSRSHIDEDEVVVHLGHEDSIDRDTILEWAKANNHGSLQIICEYYNLKWPARGSKLTFQPLEHLHPLEFNRPAETLLHIAGSTIDLRSGGTGLEVAEAHSALLSEEEATALSIWTVATICGCLRLEHVLMMFAGALLEKQIVFVCSNLGVMSAAVLAIIPLIRPYQWQSLLMPVLPNDMVEFLDAPVPYIVGIKNKSPEIHSKLANIIVIDANKNQVKSPSMPHLPQQKELLSSLSPYYAKLVGESYLARKRPVYECTDIQIEAAKGFLAVLRSYLDSLCSNLRSHTITNVQSNNDKVSLLLKESFIDSFPNRDRPFMKFFVDTQLFSVHTDLVLSFYQKD